LGYKITDISKSLGISRSSIYANIEDKPISVTANIEISSEEEYLIKRIKQLCAEHPYWGYRRITAWLKFRDKIKVNRKKVYRIMKENNLCISQRIHKAKRTPQTTKLKTDTTKSVVGYRHDKIFSATSRVGIFCSSVRLV